MHHEVARTPKHMGGVQPTTKTGLKIGGNPLNNFEFMLTSHIIYIEPRCTVDHRS